MKNMKNMKSVPMLVVCCFFFAAFAVSAFAADGLVRLQSNDSVKITGQRLEKVIKEKGLRLFTRIDHQKGAVSVGKELRSTQLFVFGNPRAGTPLMQCRQTIAIDLPQKMLVYEDEQGKTWIVYNDPAYLALRHGLGDCGAGVIKKITGILSAVSAAAAGK